MEQDNISHIYYLKDNGVDLPESDGLKVTTNDDLIIFVPNDNQNGDWRKIQSWLDQPGNAIESE